MERINSLNMTISEELVNTEAEMLQELLLREEFACTLDVCLGYVEGI